MARFVWLYTFGMNSAFPATRRFYQAPDLLLVSALLSSSTEIKLKIGHHARRVFLECVQDIVDDPEDDET